MEEIIKGHVLEHPHVTPAPRTIPRVGDVVWIRAGKHAGRVGKVSGRLDLHDGTQWMVMRDDGVIIGRYPYQQLSIIMEGS